MLGFEVQDHVTIILRPPKMSAGCSPARA